MGRWRDAGIANEIEMRNIRCLLHFTPSHNVTSILQNGILSRDDLDARSLPYLPSDAARLDRENGAISVSFPAFNHYMWRRKRDRNPGLTWVFLLLDPALLWQRRCRFYNANPATSSIQNSWKTFATLEAFQDVFRDACPSGLHQGSSYRDHHKIPSYWPTNPDAEIQVLEPIPPSSIWGAWVETGELGAVVQEFFDKFTDVKRSHCVGPFDQSFFLTTNPHTNLRWGYPDQVVPPIYPALGLSQTA